MHSFEEEDQEPVAVVRTLSDFALALTLVVLMLIGTRSAAGLRPAAEAHATAPKSGQSTPDLNLVLAPNGRFTVVSGAGDDKALDAAALAKGWTERHPSQPVTIVLQFQSEVLATDLHRGLLDLQSAFGTNLVRIDTLPKL